MRLTYVEKVALRRTDDRSHDQLVKECGKVHQQACVAQLFAQPHGTILNSSL